jgi:exodeoxyribonuclease V beta subunit
LQKEKQLSKEDELNALYVAFTRAKESLFVIHKSKDSKFEALCLSTGIHGKLQLIPKAKVPEALMPQINFRDFYYGTQADLLSQAKVDEEDHKAIEFGLALHYTLEMLSSFSHSSIRSAISITKNKFGATLSKEEFVSIEKRIDLLVKTDDFVSLVQGKVYKEKAISYNKELRYIDLLIEQDDKWIVIDYKSAMSYTQSHLKQVNFYKKAVREITAQKVEGYICYLLEEGVKLVEV